MFTVTGSNIKRLDQEKFLPITIITSEEVAARDSATPMNLMEGIPFITDIPENETLRTGSGRSTIASGGRQLGLDQRSP